MFSKNDLPTGGGHSSQAILQTTVQGPQGAQASGQTAAAGQQSSNQHVQNLGGLGAAGQAVQYAVPPDPLLESCKSSAFMRGFPSLPYDEQIGLLAYVFNSGATSPHAGEFDQLKKRFVNQPGSLPRIQALKSALWEGLISSLPEVFQGRLREQVAAVEQHFQESRNLTQCQKGYGEIIASLPSAAEIANARGGPRLPLSPPPALHDEATLAAIRAGLESGQICHPVQILAVLVHGVDKIVFDEIVKQHPGMCVKVGGYQSAETDASSAVMHVLEFQRTHANALLSSAQSFARQLAAGMQPQTHGLLTQGLSRLTYLFSVLINPEVSVFSATFRDFAYDTPTSSEAFLKLLGTSLVFRVGKNAKFGRGDKPSFEARKALAFYLAALPLLWTQEQKAALSEIMYGQLLELHVDHAYGKAARLGLPRERVPELVKQAQDVCRIFYGFMLEPALWKSAEVPLIEEGAPAVVPPQPATANAATGGVAGPAPVVQPLPAQLQELYFDAIDQLDTGADLPDTDPGYVTGEQYVARCDGLLILMAAEKRAREAGVAFDRVAFVRGCEDEKVTAVTDYLLAQIATWPA